MDSVLSKLEGGELITRDPEMMKEIHRIEASFRRVTGGIIFASLLLSGVQLYLGGKEEFSGILLLGAFIVLIITLLSSRGRNN
jgi:hypothetical protein